MWWVARKVAGLIMLIPDAGSNAAAVKEFLDRAYATGHIGDIVMVLIVVVAAVIVLASLRKPAQSKATTVRGVPVDPPIAESPPLVGDRPADVTAMLARGTSGGANAPSKTRIWPGSITLHSHFKAVELTGLGVARVPTLSLNRVDQTDLTRDEFVCELIVDFYYADGVEQRPSPSTLILTKQGGDPRLAVLTAKVPTPYHMRAVTYSGTGKWDVLADAASLKVPLSMLSAKGEMEYMTCPIEIRVPDESLVESHHQSGTKMAFELQGNGVLEATIVVYRFVR